MNYSKIYLYYDCNRPKRDLQNNILQVYRNPLYWDAYTKTHPSTRDYGILSFKVLDIIGFKHS